MKQIDAVLEYLQKHGSITSMDAFHVLGVTRLSSAIFDLRQRGHVIETESVEVKTRYDTKTTIARYRLKDKAE